MFYPFMPYYVALSKPDSEGSKRQHWYEDDSVLPKGGCIVRGWRLKDKYLLRVWCRIADANNGQWWGEGGMASKNGKFMKQKSQKKVCGGDDWGEWEVG